MKSVAAMIAVVGLWASSALGGMVVFDPAISYVNEAGAPTDAAGNPLGGANPSIAATLVADGGAWDNVTAVFGSNDGIVINGTYSAGLLANDLFSTPTDPPTRPMIYPSDLQTGAFMNGNQASPFAYITLSLTMPAGLQVGQQLTYFVDSNLDGGFSSIGAGLVSESLTGTGTISVVPEPASLALLGLGAIGLIRRRRTA